MTNRPSLWERKRSDWYRDAARAEIAEESYYVFILLAGAAFLLAKQGFEELEAHPLLAALLFVGSGLAIASFIGLRQGREWARWVGIVLSALACVGFVLSLSWFGAAVCGFTFAFLVGSRARQQFERARVGTAAEDARAAATDPE